MAPEEIPRALVGFDVDTHSVGFQAAMLGAVGQAIIATDPAGTVLFWNPAAESMFGWTSAEAVGRCVLDLTPSTQSVWQAREIMAALGAGSSWTGDFRVRRRDGSEFPALVTDTPVFADNGELMAVIGICVDVTERRLAEATARELAMVVESTSDAIFTVDTRGAVLTWNRGAEDLYGYRLAEIVGRSVSVLEPDGDDSAVTALTSAVAGDTSFRDLHAVHQHRDGKPIDVSLTISPLRYSDHHAIAVIARDTTDRLRLERELAHLATHDPLTGLPNRALLDDRLAQALIGSGRGEGEVAVAVMVIDLDQFKTINDTNGHHVGDMLLVQVAGRLRAQVRPTDTVARLGGDEFAVVCNGTDVDQAKATAGRLEAAIRADPFDIDGERRYITCSIGIAVTPPLPADNSTLLQAADAAMYEAKSRGRAQWRLFDEKSAGQSAERSWLATQLHGALKHDQLQVYYQPVIDLQTGCLVGLEALLRWMHPLRGWVPPATVVSLADSTGLGAALHRWVITTACRDMAVLRDSGLLPTGANLAVNVTARTLNDPNFVDVVCDAARAAQLPLSLLEIEVTESGILADPEAAGLVLRALRDLRIGIALDDFGGGYSSLTHLREFPVTTIKLDSKFLRNIVDQPRDVAIVTSVLDLAQKLGIRTVAEGVETTAQLSLLTQLRCDLGQGYLWSRALSRRHLEALLRRHPDGFGALNGEVSEPSGAALPDAPIDERPAPSRRPAPRDAEHA